jgi:hypothetical protein
MDNCEQEKEGANGNIHSRGPLLLAKERLYQNLDSEQSPMH